MESNSSRCRAGLVFILAASAFHTVTAESCAAQFTQCKELPLSTGDSEHKYVDHVYTRRGFGDMQSMMPPFVNLSTALLAPHASTFRVLEQGCGSGRFLLEGQSQFPMVHFYGTNFKGYGKFEHHYGQVSSNPHNLMRVAQHFHVPLMCGADARPVLPLVLLTSSIVASDFYYPVADHFFDLIVSRDALNSMKVGANESHVFIPKMLRVLKSGGLMALHLDYGVNFIFPELASKEFTIISTYAIGGVSMVLYTKQHPGDQSNFYLSFFVLLVKQCSSDVRTLTPLECIAPGYQSPFPEDMKKKWTVNTGASIPERKEATPSRIRYAFYYMKNLLDHLDSWVQAGAVPSF